MRKLFQQPLFWDHHYNSKELSDFRSWINVLLHRVLTVKCLSGRQTSIIRWSCLTRRRAHDGIMWIFSPALSTSHFAPGILMIAHVLSFIYFIVKQYKLGSVQTLNKPLTGLNVVCCWRPSLTSDHDVWGGCQGRLGVNWSEPGHDNRHRNVAMASARGHDPMLINDLDKTGQENVYSLAIKCFKKLT